MANKRISQTVLAGVGNPVANRAALAALSPLSNQSAILAESGREGTFVFSTADLSAEVAADTAQGVYVPPSSDITGASGAWVRSFTGPLQVEWFGGDNDGFAAMRTLADVLDVPSAVTNQSVLLTEQHSLSASSTLIIDGGEVYATDNTLESILLIENDDVRLECRNGGRVRGALTSAPGLAGACVLARGSSGFRCNGLKTTNGKYGLYTLDNDDMRVERTTVSGTINWGIVSGGNRDFEFRDCVVDTTTGATAADCFKVFGQSAANGSTRTSYNGAFIDCMGIGSGGVGQAFDVISDNDATDDLYNIAFTNPVGWNCGDGFFEIKVTELVVTNFPLHSITIQGGAYYGSGTESAGVQVKDRIYNIDVTGVTVHDVGIGFNTSGACRQVTFENCKAIRCRNEGFRWLATAGAGQSNRIIRPTVIDANYGQAASTYSGISLQDGDHLLIESPTVIRSQGASGNAHKYGIEILSGVTNTNIKGNVMLDDHATAAVSMAGSHTIWPEVITLPEVNLAAGSGASNLALGSHRQRFQVCAYSVVYTQASNVGRNLDIKARNTAGSPSTTIATYATNAVGALYDFAETELATPIQLTSSATTFNVGVNTDPDYPGSPTGKIIISLHGFTDASNLA